MELELFMPENKTAIISFSGGMDSTSLLMHLINKKYKIHAITFNYGQKHKIEIIKAKENIEYLKTKNYKIIHLWRVSPSRSGVANKVRTYYINGDIRGPCFGSSAGIKIVIGNKDP